MYEYLKNVDYILENSQNEQLLRMCAEECAELTQVCLKGVRALSSIDYVADTYDDIYEHLKEEIADVVNTIDVLMDAMEIDMNEIADISMSKMQRWVDRIREMKGESDE